MDSAVPYSLSDIQLPDSPNSRVKPAIKNTTPSDTLSPQPKREPDDHSDSEKQKNGLSASAKSHPKKKYLLDHASNSDFKTSLKEHIKSDSQNIESKESSKSSNQESEAQCGLKENTSDSKKICVEDEKKDSQKSVADSESDSCSDSNSNGGRKRQPRSKISIRHLKTEKIVSRSSSSNSESSCDRESAVKKSVQLKSPETESKQPDKRLRSSSGSENFHVKETSPLNPSKDVRKKISADAPQASEKHKDKSFSSSYESGEGSPVKRLKKNKDIRKNTVKDSRKNRSQSSSSSERSSQERKSNKGYMDDRKKSVKHDKALTLCKQTVMPHSSSDEHSSPSRKRSPVKQSKKDLKEGEKLNVLDKHDETVTKPGSKSASSSRTSSPERSPLKQENKRSVKSSRERSRSSSSDSLNSRGRSPVKSLKKNIKSAPNKSKESDQVIMVHRKRSSSGSPCSRNSFEKFSATEVEETVDCDAAEIVNKSQVNEPKSGLINDPPRKRLRINRNNVVIPTIENLEKTSSSIDQAKNKNPSQVSNDKTSIVSSPSSPKKEKKIKEPTCPIQFETAERELGEIVENSPEVKYEPRKLNFPGRKLSRKSSEDLVSNEPFSKKSKWGKFASSRKSSQTINISTDSLKNWFPDFKLVSEPSLVNDSIMEESPPIKEDKRLYFPLKTEEEPVKQSSTSVSHQNDEEPALQLTESLSAVSKIIFIQNLVRPFTLLQLKDLLRQTGNISEEGFWIDKIKSKCFVTYETEEEALNTRNALNGVRWPSSNPKILVVEFSTEEELDLHRSGRDAIKPSHEHLTQVQESLEQTDPQPTSDHRRKDRDIDKRKERDRFRPQAPVREWDKDKVSQDSPDRDIAGKDVGFRVSDKKDKKDIKRRTNEDTPAKLLDDLFQKTKSAPCIYWLPLTEAMLLEREESKRLRRLEREKRNQLREQEESDSRNKRPRSDNKRRDVEPRRSLTRSRSPTSRRR